MADLGQKGWGGRRRSAGHKLGKQKVSGRRKTRQHGVTFCRACPLPYFYHIPGKGFRELVTLRLLFAILLSLLEGFPKRKSGILWPFSQLDSLTLQQRWKKGLGSPSGFLHSLSHERRTHIFRGSAPFDCDLWVENNRKPRVKTRNSAQLLCE